MWPAPWPAPTCCDTGAADSSQVDHAVVDSVVQLFRAMATLSQTSRFAEIEVFLREAREQTLQNLSLSAADAAVGAAARFVHAPGHRALVFAGVRSL